MSCFIKLIHYKIVLVLLILLFLTSCYKQIVGPVVNTNIVENKHVIDGYKYNINILHLPTINNRKLEIKIDSEKVYEKTEIIQSKELEKLTKSGKFLYKTFAFGTGVAISAIASIAINPGIGLPAFAIGLWGGLYYYGELENKMPRATGKYIESRKNVINNERFMLKKQASPPFLLILKIGHRTKEYSIPQKKHIIDFINDFNLTKFSWHEIIRVGIKAPNLKTNKSIQLNSKQWTKKYFICKNPRMLSVETERGGTLVNLGFMKYRQKYEVLEEGAELIKIQFNNMEGYVNKSAGEIWWTTQDYQVTRRSIKNLFKEKKYVY